MRISRTAGRPLAWFLLAMALVLMAVRRLFVLVDLLEKGISAPMLPNEVLGLLISALMLSGVLLIQGIFRSKEVQAARLEEARAEARAEADKLGAVMTATPVPLWIAEGQDCRLIQGNPAAWALLRMPEPDDQGPSAPFIWPAHAALQRAGTELRREDHPIQRAAIQGGEVRGQALDLVFEDGSLRHVMAYATPLRDRNGRVHGAVCCLVDVTEMRHAEEALAKSQKMESLGMLAGGLAHDFNNIFQMMVANLEMAAAAAPAHSRTLMYLQRLKGGLDRATGLSRDILHCSGGDLRRPEPRELSALVSECLDRIGVPVIRDLAKDLPKVLVDPVLLGRVVEGLLANAEDASATAGGIRVRTYVRHVDAQDLALGHWPDPLEPGPYVVLEVSDQGHGIEPNTLPKIFDPFFSTRDLGRGLGLAAALGIIRGHRGGIQVESIPGVGSVFRIHLPCPEGQAPSLVPAEEHRLGRNLVLLADDEADLCEVLAEMLRDWFGLEVVTALDGLEALELFRQRPEAFDLVILDATMPRMGGVEAFQAMRALRPHLPGILSSGYALPVSREQALAQGFVDFLKKPFTSAELEPLIDRAMGAKAK
ncbi:response regulator [Geothrix sp. PMB-07]|uniref:hybrid sensor histidine kinase/response regulator n=1 Tax=Geothrix sp. PMB-07 TaxID=3068640 RepID=UPI002741DF8B|nr:response regulator [Geothrix sp. PMB-07]WLT30701.1 response regulator [Geothrix sp. PMB-07]